MLQATLRKTRPRTDLIPVVTAIDGAIRALEAQAPGPGPPTHRPSPSVAAAIHLYEGAG